MIGPSRGGTMPCSNPRRSLGCRPCILGIRVTQRWSRIHYRNSYISTSIISPLGWSIKLAYKLYLLTEYTLHNRIDSIYYLNSHARRGAAVLCIILISRLDGFQAGGHAYLLRVCLCERTCCRAHPLMSVCARDQGWSSLLRVSVCAAVIG